jgi:thioesterase domain-containing protein
MSQLQPVSRDEALLALDALLNAMPPVAAMGVRASAGDGDFLRLQAPLAKNLNDKGCAFGGSLAGVMTLAGWGLATCRLQAEGLAAEVYVADSQLRYLAPLYDDLLAEARLADGERWPEVLARLRQRRRARLSVRALTLDRRGAVVAELDARFALIIPPSPGDAPP